jgi:hypothetical protein
MQVKPLGFIDQSEGVQISARSWRWLRRSKIWQISGRYGVDKAGDDIFLLELSLTLGRMKIIL